MTVRDRDHRAAGVQADPRWASLTSGVRGEDTFYYSVRTTGVYCRPSCQARRPRPENVAFHATREEAERLGFRPCQRCRPDEPSRKTAAVVRACRLLESAERPPSLAELATAVGMSPHHLHRTFKHVTGLTPATYGRARRREQLRRQLDQQATVTDALYAAGYGSAGRLYADSDTALGMTPSDYRAGGVGQQVRFAVGECSLGSILVAQSQRGICAITLGNDPDTLVKDLQQRFPNANFIGGDAGFEQVVSRVVGFIEAPRLGLDLPLDIRGTAFQQRVWQALREIPCGETATYAEIAERLDSPRAVRAVAGACAANPLAVAIPCHRVVRKNGSLSGYRWGVDRKRCLLEREKALSGD